MTLLEVMERVGSKEPSLIKAFVNDALDEISEMPQNVTYETIDVVSGTREYDLPSTLVKLLDVYQLYEDNKYYKISRIENVKAFEDITGGSSSSSSIVVI